MSRRVRAIAFAACALGCAALAAGVAGGYRADVAAELGELRPVVIAAEPLSAGRPLRPAAVERSLEVRRVPERFVPPEALATPAEAIGRAPVARVPAGSYMVASQLADSRPARSRRRQVGPRRAPVDIAVSAAGALARFERRGPRRVDVIVTTEPGPGGGRGRTYVATRNVRLLDLRSAEGEPDPAPSSRPGSWVATLALTRPQSLRLIQAESFAHQVRVIPR
jgi:Flp pilus assembly protein CpaB